MTTQYEFRFDFYDDSEPKYILHHNDHIDIMMLHMLVEFKVDINNIKDLKITKL